MQFDISAIELSTLIKNCDPLARKLLLQRGISGQFDAKVGCLKRARKGRKPGEARNVVLNRSDWEALADAGELARLLQGDPITLTDADGNITDISGGVLFRRDQIDDLLRQCGGGNAPSRRGRPAKLDERDEAWLALMQITMEGRLDTAFRAQAQLVAEVSDRIGNSLSDETLKPIVKKAWLKFVEPPVAL